MIYADALSYAVVIEKQYLLLFYFLSFFFPKGQIMAQWGCF